MYLSSMNEERGDVRLTAARVFVFILNVAGGLTSLTAAAGELLATAFSPNNTNGEKFFHSDWAELEIGKTGM